MCGDREELNGSVLALSSTERVKREGGVFLFKKYSRCHSQEMSSEANARLEDLLAGRKHTGGLCLRLKSRPHFDPTDIMQ